MIILTRWKVLDCGDWNLSWNFGVEGIDKGLSEKLGRQAGVLSRLLCQEKDEGIGLGYSSSPLLGPAQANGLQHRADESTIQTLLGGTRLPSGNDPSPKRANLRW